MNAVCVCALEERSIWKDMKLYMTNFYTNQPHHFIHGKQLWLGIILIPQLDKEIWRELYTQEKLWLD